MTAFTTAPGAAYFTFSHPLQAFYAARGMWANGEPRGALTNMVGQRTPWGSAGGATFFVTNEQLAALTLDISHNGPRGMNRWQVAQSLRRLREAASRSGQPTVSQRSVATVPFEPLICPPCGKARKAFERHVMDSLHATIDFSQESVY